MNERIDIGHEIHKCANELWPLIRSITGQVVRQALERIKFHLPALQLKSITPGSVSDWTSPKECNVNEAYIVSPCGERFCDFRVNNVHLVGNSIPFEGKIGLTELKKHLYTLPDQPNAVPYIASYYKERWGFCLSQDVVTSLKRASVT